MKPKVSVNPCSESELTIAKLRSYQGFEKMSDEQAEQAIIFIKKMAKVLFNLYRENEGSEPQ